MRFSDNPHAMRRAFVAVTFLAAALFYLAFVLRPACVGHGVRYFTLVDDAMISMRYAQHIAAGAGPVWNVGQPPIEGFTNPAWVAWMAIVQGAAVPERMTSLVIELSGLVALLVNLVVIARLSDALTGGRFLARAIAAPLVAFHYPLVFWTLRGMEVGVLVLLIDYALLVLVRAAKDDSPPPLMPLALATIGLVAIRMDGLVPVLVIFGFAASEWTRHGSLRKTIALALVIVVALGMLTAVRLHTFGDWLPNTYYLKVNGVPFAVRIRGGLYRFFRFDIKDVAVAIAIVTIGFAWFPALWSRRHAWLAGLFLAVAAYSIYVGGDFAEDAVGGANRFVVLGVPALFVLVGVVCSEIMEPFTLDARRAVVVATCVAACITWAGDDSRYKRWVLADAHMTETDIPLARLGLALRDRTGPAAVIAAHSAGQIGFFSRRTIVDLLGKSDRRIAHGPPAGPFIPGHNKWNYAYSIGELQPDVIADADMDAVRFLAGHPEYERLADTLWVRRNSRQVDRTGLTTRLGEWRIR